MVIYPDIFPVYRGSYILYRFNDTLLEITGDIQGTRMGMLWEYHGIKLDASAQHLLEK